MANGNLGIKRKDLRPSAVIGIGVEENQKDRENEIQYPNFTIENKHIEAAGLEDVSPDDVVEFTVRARIQSVKKKSKQSKDIYDSDRVELEVQDISDVTMIESNEEDSEEKKDDDSKMGYDTSSMRKGGGSVSPKEAGVSLKK